VRNFFLADSTTLPPTRNSPPTAAARSQFFCGNFLDLDLEIALGNPACSAAHSPPRAAAA
jgi:hypothetical protein